MSEVLGQRCGLMDCAEQEGKAMLAVHRRCEQAPEWVARVARLRDESPAERKLIAGLWIRCPTFCQL